MPLESPVCSKACRAKARRYCLWRECHFSCEQVVFFACDTKQIRNRAILLLVVSARDPAQVVRQTFSTIKRSSLSLFGTPENLVPMQRVANLGCESQQLLRSCGLSLCSRSAGLVSNWNISLTAIAGFNFCSVYCIIHPRTRLAMRNGPAYPANRGFSLSCRSFLSPSVLLSLMTSFAVFHAESFQGW